jgi:hypothetical protein
VSGAYFCVHLNHVSQTDCDGLTERSPWIGVEKYKCSVVRPESYLLHLCFGQVMCITWGRACLKFMRPVKMKMIGRVNITHHKDDILFYFTSGRVLI